MSQINQFNMRGISKYFLRQCAIACLLTCGTALLAAPVSSQMEVCATAKVQFSSELVLARTVFEAQFGLNNETTAVLEDVNVTFTVTDAMGNDAYSVFSVGDPQTTGFLGSPFPSSPSYELGDLIPGASGTASWFFVPLDSATPLDVNETYFIGGTLSYMKNGVIIVAPLFPEDIVVVPNADLSLQFFLQRRVFSDNALTPGIIEPAEPFSLGLLVVNSGGGTANSVSIKSNLPTILDNPLGLPLAFDILGVQSGFNPPLLPSNTINLGNIEPGGIRTVRWEMVSSLEGDFSAPEADFQYMTSLGIPVVPLINVKQNVPGLVHMVDLGVNSSFDDGLPDFLVSDDQIMHGTDPFTGKPFEDVPTEFWASSGEVVSITPRLNQEAIVGSLSDMNLVATLQVNYPSAGWFYTRVDDVGGSNLGVRAFDLVQSTRYDSIGSRTSLNVGGPGDISNIWTTSRLYDLASDPLSEPDGTQYLLHLFEYIPAPGIYNYDLVYQPAPEFGLTADSNVLSVSNSVTQSQTLTLNGGMSNAGNGYLVVGTTSGTSPGLLVNGVPVPINVDSYTKLLLRPVLINAFQLLGVFDSVGTGSSEIVIPPGLDPAVWAGMQFDYAYITFDQVSGIVIGSSNAVSLTLTF